LFEASSLVVEVGDRREGGTRRRRMDPLLLLLEWS
jgi:hypothetical protein